MITVSNIRAGFAANSSSTHSVIFMKKKPRGVDEDHDFEWDNFTLVTMESRRRYFIAQLARNLSDRIGEENAATFIRGMFDGAGEIASIDHQSVLCMPSSFDGKFLDMEFAQAMHDAMTADGVVILGGNDNGGPHPLYEPSKCAPWHVEMDKDNGRNLVVRRDGEWWVLFNRDNGHKTRISFSRDPKPYDKASWPELVDVKITDFCPFNCSFCYQGSTLAGRHAERATISDLAYELGKMKVFEVALGGGEPTLHPELADFVEKFRYYKIVANMTTKNINWLSSASGREICSLLGTIAVSVEKADDIKRAAMSGVKNLAAQVVMGTVTDLQFKHIVQVSNMLNVNLTLLGYKTTHRGGKHKPIPYEWWIDFCRDRSRISVDTVMIQQYGPRMEAAGIDPVCMHAHEGTHSCYVDAVSKRFGKSSFVAEDEYHGFTDATELGAWWARQ